METLSRILQQPGLANISSIGDFGLVMIALAAEFLVSLVIVFLWSKRKISGKAAQYTTCYVWALLVIPSCFFFQTLVAMGITMLLTLKMFVLWEVTIRLRAKQEDRAVSVPDGRFSSSELRLVGWGIVAAILIIAAVRYVPGFITSLHAAGQIYAFSMHPLPLWVTVLILPWIIIGWLMAILLLSGMEKSKRATRIVALIMLVIASYSVVMGACYGHVNASGIGYIIPQNYFREKAVSWGQIEAVAVRYGWPDRGWFLVKSKKPQDYPSLSIPFNIRADYNAWREMMAMFQAHNIPVTPVSRQEDTTFLLRSSDTSMREFRMLLQGKAVAVDKTAQAAARQIVKDEQFIRGMINGTYLGAEVGEAMAKLGAPDKRTEHGQRSIQLDYGNISYGFLDSRLNVVMSHSDTVALFGVKAGMSIPEVKSILGKPSSEAFVGNRRVLAYQAGKAYLEVWSSGENAPVSIIIFWDAPSKQ
jgi:hypothetical protein